MTTENTERVVLTIAGFDPSGGAGIIADIKTLISFGCRPVAAITSLTFQNSEKLFGAIHQSADSLRTQILPVVDEFHLAATKIGMLPTRELVLEVARLLRETSMPAPVVDPVMRTSSGYELIEPDAQAAWLTELMRLARVITPNIPEAESLTGMAIRNESDMRVAANNLRQAGARAVLIKGGHLPLSLEAVDLLDDDGAVMVFRGEWVDAPSVRGTGCMLSSAVAACLSQGNSLEDSVRSAKQFVKGFLTSSKRPPVGRTDADESSEN